MNVPIFCRCLKEHANLLHAQSLLTNPAADAAIPLAKPNWTYQLQDARVARFQHMIICLLEGMTKNSNTRLIMTR